MGGAHRDGSPFAAVCQIGMVVRNMDAALEYFQALGIGPFESSEIPHPSWTASFTGDPRRT